MTEQIVGYIDPTGEHPEDNWSALVPDHDRGRLFHDECQYLWQLHTDGRCPTELGGTGDVGPMTRTYTPTPEYQQVPFKVTCEDAWNDEFGGPRIRITVVASGPQDAMNRIKSEYPDLRVLRAERA